MRPEAPPQHPQLVAELRGGKLPSPPWPFYLPDFSPLEEGLPKVGPTPGLPPERVGHCKLLCAVVLYTEPLSWAL